MLERLDRALANDSWISSFPQCLVSHLPRIKLDHRPILLRTNPEFKSGFGRPFRFLAGWMKHEIFPSFIRDKWEFSGNMVVSLSDFSTHVK